MALQIRYPLVFHISLSSCSVEIIHLLVLTSVSYLFIYYQILFYRLTFLCNRFLLLVIYCIPVLENSWEDRYTFLHKYLLVIISFDLHHLHLYLNIHLTLVCEWDTLIKGVWYQGHLILEFLQSAVS